jgi:hypothetical protein
MSGFAGLATSLPCIIFIYGLPKRFICLNAKKYLQIRRLILDQPTLLVLQLLEPEIISIG